MSRNDKFIFSSLFFLLLFVGGIPKRVRADQEGRNGHLDGYYWTSLGNVGKTHFINGFFSALTISPDKRYPLKGIKSNQLVDALDIIYKNYENKEITVFVAAYIALCRIKGAHEKEIHLSLEEARYEIDQIYKIPLPATR